MLYLDRTTPESMLTRAIVAMSAAGGDHMVPCLRAVRERITDLLQIYRGDDAVPARFLRTTGPLLIILGDDDFQPGGPGTWPQAAKLVRWAKYTHIHGCAANAIAYGTAAAMAATLGRALLIESSAANAEAWFQFVEHNTPPGAKRSAAFAIPGTMRPLGPVH